MQTTASDSVDAKLVAARDLYERDDVAQAESLLRELAVRAPVREDVAVLLGEVLRSQGRLGAAAAAMSSVAEASGFDAGVALRATAFARECDRHAVAAWICDGALTHGAKTPELLLLAGHIARESGNFKTARAHYLAAIDVGIDLDRQNVLGALANTKRYTDPADPDRARCEMQFHDAARPLRSRASSGYALGKILDDLGDWSGAARVLRKANELARASRPWERGIWQRFVEMRKGEKVATRVSATPSGFVPVFIVGVPRSGTTLTATHLARATGARDRGELRALRFIAERLRGGGHLDNAGVVNEAAELYRKMAQQDDEPAHVYLDQDPLNFRWLDIATAMFPQAKVIHLRRDPRDTALSLWSQEFAHADMALSRDFGDIAAIMRGHAALMA